MSYPSRPIRFIVPFPPGGSADGIARIIAQQMTQVMGQQWLVDNRPGADGVLAQAQAGRLRMVAVLLPRRSSLVPDVPTIAEAGMPGVSISPWQGVFGPPGMSRDIVARLSRDLNTVLSRPEARDQIGKQSVEVQTSTAAELTVHTRDQYLAWSKVIRETGIPQE